MGFIYKATNTANGKKYIGQTTQPVELRWNSHIRRAIMRDDSTYFHNAIRKYGADAFEFSVIEEVPDGMLNEREQFWIALYDTFVHGYNLTRGGEGGRKIDRQKVTQMWDNGKSVHEIAAFTNNSIAGVRNVLKTHSGFSKSASMARAENKRRKAVSQYDLNGDYIQTFGSVRAAAKACGVSHTCVLDACNGKGSIAGGYQWRFAGSDSPNQFSDRRKIKVNQYDLGGNFIATYNSIDEASRAINSNHKSILKCCMGLQHTAGGFQWRHSTETLLLHILAEGEKSSSAIWPVTKSMYSTPYRKRLRKVECTQTVSVLVALGGRNPLASLCGHMQIRGEAYCHSEIHVSALLRSNGEVYLAISLRSDLQTVLQYTCYFFC